MLTRITELDLRDNLIGQTGARAIAQSVQALHHLTTLNLSGNQGIGARQAAALLDSLHTRTSLTSIGLRNAANTGYLVQNEGPDLHLLQDLAPALAALDLSNNKWRTYLGEDSTNATQLGIRLHNCQALTKLDVSSNGLGNTNTILLLNGWAACGGKNSLDISGNGLCMVGTNTDIESHTHLGIRIKSLQTIRHLRLADNYIGTQGAARLLIMLTPDSLLQTLDLAANDIDDGIEKVIRKYLDDTQPRRNNLNLLGLKWNRLSPEAQKRLRTGGEEQKRGTELQIHTFPQKWPGNMGLNNPEKHRRAPPPKEALAGRPQGMCLFVATITFVQGLHQVTGQELKCAYQGYGVDTLLYYYAINLPRIADAPTTFGVTVKTWVTTEPQRDGPNRTQHEQDKEWRRFVMSRTSTHTPYTPDQRDLLALSIILECPILLRQHGETPILFSRWPTHNDPTTAARAVLFTPAPATETDEDGQPLSYGHYAAQPRNITKDEWRRASTPIDDIAANRTNYARAHPDNPQRRGRGGPAPHTPTTEGETLGHHNKPDDGPGPTTKADADNNEIGRAHV